MSVSTGIPIYHLHMINTKLTVTALQRNLCASGQIDCKNATMSQRNDRKDRSPVGRGDRKDRSPVCRGDRKDRSPVGRGDRKDRSPVGRGDRKDRSPVGRGDRSGSIDRISSAIYIMVFLVLFVHYVLQCPKLP